MGNSVPYLLLGVSYTVVTIICLGLLCFFSSAFASRGLHNSRFTTIMHRITGVLFIIMGISVAFLDQ